MFHYKAHSTDNSQGHGKCTAERANSITKKCSDGSPLLGMLVGQIVMELGLLIFTGKMWLEEVEDS